MRARTLSLPPRLHTASGAERRVGVELEFAAISARNGAKLVQSLFGGTIEEEDPHRFHIKGGSFGDFTCELDTQFAHRSYAETERNLAPPEPYSFTAMMGDFQAEMRRIYGEISSVVVPCEIVCPPIAITALPRLDDLIEALVAAGAMGTRSSPFYAFGAQLNPEIATDDPAWLTAMLKAYLLVSDWLRAVIAIDTTRQLVAFADPFPNEYVSKVVDPAYWPDRATLMEDFLAWNPTRNRELDLLPLFMTFDPGQVRRKVTDLRVKPRPTFHYRLPDANLGEPGWDIVLEWNRWCVVEKLAERREILDDMGRDYADHHRQLMPAQDWAVRSSEWLVLA